MIRAALISIAFLGITLTLILMQPRSESDLDFSQQETESEVSRSQTSFESLSDLSLSEDEIAEDTNISGQIIVETPQLDFAEPDIQPTQYDTPAPTTQSTDKITLGSTQSDETALEQLVVKALRQGQSEAYIDALVNDAAQKGQVAVPQALITQDGRIDTGSLLAVLSTPASSETDRATSYVVQPGDSLASISYRFFGSTSMATEIFAANRSILSSKDHVEIGQKLIIPQF